MRHVTTDVECIGGSSRFKRLEIRSANGTSEKPTADWSLLLNRGIRLVGPQRRAVEGVWHPSSFSLRAHIFETEEAIHRPEGSVQPTRVVRALLGSYLMTQNLAGFVVENDTGLPKMPLLPYFPAALHCGFQALPTSTGPSHRK